MPVSVVMIAKDCPEALAKCLESLNKNFIRGCDEIVVGNTGTPHDATAKVAEEYGARVIDCSRLRKDARPYVEEWLPEKVEYLDKEPQFKDGFILDFAEARQVVTDAARHDICFWIDADDILQEETPGALRDLTDRVFLAKQADTIFLNYLYTFDETDGKLTTVLKRERVFDRRVYRWKGRCHETLIPPDGRTPRPAWFQDLNACIVHTEHRKNHTVSDIRNYVIIRREIEEAQAAGRRPDPRSLFYLANAARGLEKFGDSIELYREHLKWSGSRDDRFSSLYFSGITYLHKTIRRPYDSLKYFFDCVKCKPEDPRGYYGLARAYFLLKKPNESLHWFKVGQMLPEPTTSLHSYDPEHVRSLPIQIACLAAKELGDENLTIEYLTRLKQVRPDHPDTQEVEGVIKSWYAGRKLIAGVQSLATNTVGVEPGDKKAYVAAARSAVARLKCVPEELEEEGLGALEPKTDTDVTIFCGPTTEPWGPKSTGIGGSERMVIELVPRIVKEGKSVVVYCKCPLEQRGLDKETGVIWRHYGEIDWEQPRKTLVLWRAPEAVELPLAREKTVVWCHDVQTPDRWTPSILATVDKVVVQSEYHATTLGEEVREQLGDKLVISRNGVDISRFKGGRERDKNKIVFCSSPDRGILTALEILRKAKKRNAAMKDAKLHVYYGFTPAYMKRCADYEYGHIPDLGQDANFYEYMACVYKQADESDDIIFHGRVSWDEMAKELETAHIWLYPTRFQEISCMSAMEAQCAGCKIAATDSYALDETIDWERATVLPVWENENLHTCADYLARLYCEDDYADAEAAKKRFSMDSLAKDWVHNIL